MSSVNCILVAAVFPPDGMLVLGDRHYKVVEINPSMSTVSLAHTRAHFSVQKATA